MKTMLAASITLIVLISFYGSLVASADAPGVSEGKRCASSTYASCDRCCSKKAPKNYASTCENHCRLQNAINHGKRCDVTLKCPVCCSQLGSFSAMCQQACGIQKATRKGIGCSAVSRKCHRCCRKSTSVVVCELICQRIKRANNSGVSCASRGPTCNACCSHFQTNKFAKFCESVCDLHKALLEGQECSGPRPSCGKCCSAVSALTPVCKDTCRDIRNSI